MQLRDIGLARYLDRREIVRSSADYKLGVSNNDWWGEPLGGMLSRVHRARPVAAPAVEQRLWRGRRHLGRPQRDVLAVNIQRLEPDAARHQRRAAGAGGGRVQPAAPHGVNRSFQIVKPVSAATVAGQVAATSDAIGELTDGLAALARQRM